jgi:periplasmic protein TonB
MFGVDKNTLLRWSACFALALLLHVAIAAAMLVMVEDNAATQSPDSVVHINLVAAAPSAQRVIERPTKMPEPVVSERPPVKSLPPAAITPQAAASSEIAPREIVSSEILPSEIVPAPLTPNIMAPDSVTQSDAVREDEIDASITAPRERESVPAKERYAVAQDQVIASWHQQVRAYLHRHKRYPRQALARRQEGVVTVRVVVDRRGKVIASALVQSAGTATLDRAAIALLAIASPLPAPPHDVADKDLILHIPIEYNLGSL